MDSWAKDWNNSQDAVYDKIRSSVITSKEMFEASIRTDERDRIVALLEEYIPTFYELSPNSDAGKYPIEGIIELIKGETNE